MREQNSKWQGNRNKNLLSPANNPTNGMFPTVETGRAYRKMVSSLAALPVVLPGLRTV